MRATLGFKLPKEKFEYNHALYGIEYFKAINEYITDLDRWIDKEKNESHIAVLEEARSMLFEACRVNGFSPWEDQ